MRSFKNILIGLMAGLALFPLIDKFYEVISLWIETLKVTPSKRILELQKQNAIMSEFTKPINNQNNNDDKDIIYFYYEEDEEDE